MVNAFDPSEEDKENIAANAARGTKWENKPQTHLRDSRGNKLVWIYPHEGGTMIVSPEKELLLSAVNSYLHQTKQAKPKKAPR